MRGVRGAQRPHRLMCPVQGREQESHVIFSRFKFRLLSF